MRTLFEISADNLNHVLSGFLGRFRIFRHVVEDVIFHELAHEAVDRPTGGSETAKDLGALFVAIRALSTARRRIVINTSGRDVSSARQPSSME